MLFAERLKALRKANGKLQKDLALFLGVTERHYRLCEAGKVDIPTSKLTALANFFDVSVDYLLGLSDAPASLEIAVAVPLEYHDAIFDELKKFNVNDSQINQSGHRSQVVGEGFIIGGLTPSEVKIIANAIVDFVKKIAGI